MHELESKADVVCLEKLVTVLLEVVQAVLVVETSLLVILLESSRQLQIDECTFNHLIESERPLVVAGLFIF